MNSKWKLIEKIISGEKTIESRWYKTKRAPWNKISKGDIVYFKDSGKPISAKAEVSNVIQFENIDIKTKKEILKKYGCVGKICLANIANTEDFIKEKSNCILIFIKNPKKIKKFNIRKKGFGIGSAWITVDHIKKLRM